MKEAASLPFSRGEKEIPGIATQQRCLHCRAQGSRPPPWLLDAARVTWGLLHMAWVRNRSGCWT